MKVNSLDGLAAVQRVLRERRRRAEEEAARRAAEEAARRREHELFERSVGPVVRLRSRNLAEIARPRPLPHPRQRELDEAAAIAESLASPLDLDDLIAIGEADSFLRSDLPRTVLRDLRRGRWAIQRHLDLHGLNRHQAHDEVAIFLAEATAAGKRCVRIVHGKGPGSPGRVPVLKGRVQRWLVQKKEVLAFVQARPLDGGAGALVVLLQPGGR